LGLLDRWQGAPLLRGAGWRDRYCRGRGGTKNPDISRILELRPDLVVVNREENRREDYDALVAAGLNVHVTHPRTVADAADMLKISGAW
jgi:ABC-type Fe3+-hydroxamate transport system substrate-binding protein